MRIISVINYKGGVGKTTLTANLGAELARQGKRVLLIDLDPQSSLTYSFYAPKTNFGHRHIMAWYESMVRGKPQRDLAEFISAPPEVNDRIRERGGFLGLIASHLNLINTDVDLLLDAGAGPAPDREVYLLRKALAEALRHGALAQYDYVLVDCPPNFNIVTQAGIVASNHMLVPARPDYLSTLGISSLLGAVAKFVGRYNDQVRDYSDRPMFDVIDPKPLGVVFTMVRYTTPQPIADHQFYMNQAGLILKDVNIFKARIRDNVAFARGGNNLPVILHGNMTQRYYIELMGLATEFLSHFENTDKTTSQNKRSAA